MNWDEQLSKSIRSYDFDLMIQSCKNGAKTDDLILHRVINRDRADLLELFLFSKEIPQNLSLHYDYEVFGKQPALPYAAMCGSFECVNFLLHDSRVCDTFDYPTIAQKTLNEAGNGNWNTLNYLLHNKKIMSYAKMNLEVALNAAERKRVDIVENLILHYDDISLIEQLMHHRYVKNSTHNELYQQAYNSRLENEVLVQSMYSIGKENKIRM